MRFRLTRRQMAGRRRSPARLRRIILALFLIVLAFALGPARRLLAVEETAAPAANASTEAAQASAPSAKPTLIYQVRVSKEIGRIMTTYLGRAFREAEEAGADLVIVELDTPGGTLQGSVKGSKVISASKTPTVAWIHTEATSGGAMLAYACRDMVVSNTGTIGDVIPIMIGPQAEIIEAPEKIVGYVAQFMRSNAEANGHDPDLAEAMVRKSMRIRYEDYADKMAKKGIQLGIPPQYQDKDAATERPAAETPAAESSAPEGAIVQPTAEEYGKEYVTKRDEILNLSWREALFLRVAIGRAMAIDRTDANPGVEAITDIDKFSHLRGARIVAIEESWSEVAADFLSNPAIVVLLLIGAFVGIGTELKVPGFGFPGILGISCLVLLFFGQLGAGAAAWTDLILLIVGLILLGIELFLIPGFGIVGILGIICILAGLFMMLTENPPKAPERLPIMPGQLLHTALLLCIAIIGSAVALFLVYYFVLPRTQFLGALVLTSQQKRATGYHASEGTDLAEPEKLVGRIGVAKTKLRPAGRAVFDGEPYDVVTQGDYIESGTEVEIVEVESNRIVVRKARRGSESKG